MSDDGLLSRLVLVSVETVFLTLSQVVRMFADMCTIGITLTTVGAVLFLVGFLSGPHRDETEEVTNAPSAPANEEPRKPS